MPGRKAWQVPATAAVSGVLGLAIAAGAVWLAGPWDGGQRKAERSWAAAQDSGGRPRRAAASPAPSAGPVLSALGRAATDDPGAAKHAGAAREAAEDAEIRADLTRRLGPLLADGALGPDAAGSVVDIGSGRALYARNAAKPMTPASTIKLATMTAALAAAGPGHRIPTTVVAAPGSHDLTLVGGGDPSLNGTALGKLADETLRALRARKITTVRLAYDTSLYSGPVRHPIGPNDNIAPVVSLMSDEGREGPGPEGPSGPAPRSDDPAGDAARQFAGLLRDQGLHVTGAPRHARAPKGAKQLAVTYSAPLADLVEHTLTESDNDYAEALARQAALATGRPASFAGGAAAVRAELAKLRMPLSGAVITDGSGLNRKDRATPRLLTSLLTLDADPHHPGLRPVLTGLPVARFSGTLASRYADAAGGSGAGAASGAGGEIRAKTGTLTGVNTLAGTVVDANGRLLAFAFMAGDTSDEQGAEQALDRVSAALAP